VNRAKAEFFDSQVNEQWATAEFGDEEKAKIDRMLMHASLREGSRVIEPGCGAGRLTAILARAVGPTGLVLAFDISAAMIEAARHRIGSVKNVCFQFGPVEQYPFASGKFDAVICHNVFPHFDDKPKAVAHLAFALKPRGKFIVFHFMNSAGINDLHRKAHASVLNDLIPSETNMRSLFNDAGLEIDLLEDDDFGYLLSAARIYRGLT